MRSKKQALARLLNTTDTKASRRLSLAIQLLIVLSLVTGALDSLPDLPVWARIALGVSEISMVLVFTAEYLLRVYSAGSRWRFILSFFGLVDLVAILPFYLATGLDLRSIRALRLLRVFRVFKLARYGRVMERFRRAFSLAKEELVVFLIVSMIVLYIAAVGIYYCERAAQPDVFSSIPHALWWAVATLTTVGYGDIFPITPWGKIFTGLILLIGVGLVAVPSGIFATALSEARHMEEDQPLQDGTNPENTLE